MKAEREVEVLNKMGLHARPAAEFVRCVQRFESEIIIRKGDESFVASSILEVLMANLDHGCKFIIEASGDDAGCAVEQLAALLADFRSQEESGRC